MLVNFRILIEGIFNHKNFLDIIRNFTIFEVVEGKTIKKIPRYQQYRAVHKTVEKISKGKNKKEKGCTEPLYGKKAKCIIKIVPQEEKCKTLQIDKECIKTRE